MLSFTMSLEHRPHHSQMNKTCITIIDRFQKLISCKISITLSLSFNHICYHNSWLTRANNYSITTLLSHSRRVNLHTISSSDSENLGEERLIIYHLYGAVASFTLCPPSIMHYIDPFYWFHTKEIRSFPLFQKQEIRGKKLKKINEDQKWLCYFLTRLIYMIFTCLFEHVRLSIDIYKA